MQFDVKEPASCHEWHDSACRQPPCCRRTLLSHPEIGGHTNAHADRSSAQCMGTPRGATVDESRSASYNGQNKQMPVLPQSGAWVREQQRKDWATTLAERAGFVLPFRFLDPVSLSFCARSRFLAAAAFLLASCTSQHHESRCGWDVGAFHQELQYINVCMAGMASMEELRDSAMTEALC